jgi:von Willebrand factor A domain-containing protein 7
MICSGKAMAMIHRVSGVANPGRMMVTVLTTLLLYLIITISRLSAQQSQPNRSRKFGTDSCGPVDPTYIRIANETGGQPMFLQPSEAGKAGHFMRESMGENAVTLLWATGKLEGATREFTIPVDSSVDRTTFSLSTDTKGTSMTLLRPSGEEINAGTAGVEISELNCGRIVTVASPEAGDWRAQIAGSGTFWVQAQGKSEIYFVTVEFVRAKGRPGHQGYFRIPGQPIAGEPATLQVELSGLARDAAFELVTEDGKVIQPIHLRPETSGDDSEYYGSFELPARPFRVAVTGRDDKGNDYQRYFHTLFRAENVEVIPERAVTDDLRPGKTTSVNYTVRNVGPAAAFRIVVYDTRHFLSRVEPRELKLETGASANVSVDLSVPAETQPGTGLDLTITATSASDPATTNGNSQHLSVFTAANR